MKVYLRVLGAGLAVGCLLALMSAASAADGVIVAEPELTMMRSVGNETCAMPGSGYENLVINDESATFTLTEHELAAGSKRIGGNGIRRVSWEPAAGDTLVTIEFAQPPSYHMFNVVSGTEFRPQTPQVIAGFGFDISDAASHVQPVMGAHKPRADYDDDQYGSYELPDFAPVKYSDALVTLNVHNVDFRDVIWLMSQIGNVSIVLDPYWADEPTGGPRPPGGGADPGSGGGSGGSGFRPGGEFLPNVPREGTGRLTLNFKAVPFDTALELVLMSVGLYKVDIYPGSFD